MSNLKKNSEEIKKKYSGVSLFEEAEPTGAEGQFGWAVRNLSIYSLLCTRVLEAVSCRYQGMIVYSKLPLLLIFFFPFLSKCSDWRPLLLALWMTPKLLRHRVKTHSNLQVGLEHHRRQTKIFELISYFSDQNCMT